MSESDVADRNSSGRSALRDAYLTGGTAWAFALLLLSLYALDLGLALEINRAHDPLGGRFFPVVISSLLATAATVILATPLVRYVLGFSPYIVDAPETAAPVAIEAGSTILKPPIARVLAMMFASAAYVALLSLIGYIPATILGLAAALYILGTRGATGLIVTPVVTTAILFVVFTYALLVRLP